MSTRASEQPNMLDDVMFRERAIESDAEFKRIMLHAIWIGRENPPIGIDHRPCTKNPRFVAHRPRPLVRVTNREDA